jgi:hypothetical protein
MTQAQRNALADRIAAVLQKRQEVGAEKRRQEHEYERRNGERSLARYRKLAARRSDDAIEPSHGYTQRSGPLY